MRRRLNPSYQLPRRYGGDLDEVQEAVDPVRACQDSQLGKRLQAVEKVSSRSSISDSLRAYFLLQDCNLRRNRDKNKRRAGTGTTRTGKGLPLHLAWQQIAIL
jgi:hypothetical protein